MTELLTAERKRSKLHLEQLINLLDGGKEITERKRRISEQLTALLGGSETKYTKIN